MITPCIQCQCRFLGSVLILESLALFISILSAGIKIVTLADSQEYTADSMNNIGSLVISLVSMARAHEESHMMTTMRDMPNLSRNVMTIRSRHGPSLKSTFLVSKWYL